MSGKIDCAYATPCGWCSKWDKECDERMYTYSYRIKHPRPIVLDNDENTNKENGYECDHEWEFCGVSTGSSKYRCKKCNAYKEVPYTFEPIDVSVTI